MNKSLCIVVTGFLGMGTLICSDSVNHEDSYSPDDSALITQSWERYRETMKEQRKRGAEKARISAGPCKEEDLVAHQRFENLPFLDLDFILWNVQQEGNNYAATGVATVIPDGTDVPYITSQGEVYRPPSKMTPGFKVALGLNLKRDLWDVVLRYTWLSYHGSGEVSSYNPYTGIQALFQYSPASGILSQGYVQTATVSSKLHFNALDSELGKNLYLSPSFYLRIFFGLKGVWSKENFSTNYFVNDLNTLTLLLGNNLVKYTQNYWGVGPRLGAYGCWECIRHLGLFVETAFSALWSGVNLKSYSYDTDLTVPYSGVLIASQQYRMHTLIPVFELSTGIQTDWIFKHGNRLVILAGWETQMFLFQAQHSSSIADISLNMQGLTLKFRYDF